MRLREVAVNAPLIAMALLSCSPAEQPQAAAPAVATRPGAAAVQPAAQRELTFRYEVEIVTLPEGTGPIDVFVPLAQSDEHQRVIDRSIEASIQGEERTEPKYGNRFWHGHVDRSDGKPIKVAVHYRIVRKAVVGRMAAATEQRQHDASERAEHALFLGSNERVPVQGSIIDRVLADLPIGDETPLGRARAIYDYVIDNMEYKKVGKGWGNGDTHWACSKKYGNCTDFHALFISLARAQGIPARFEIGFPLPEDRQEGEIHGYHCWVQFHIAGSGWLPIDASEAWKHPHKRDSFFGSQPPDRIKLTVGRDLELGEGHTTYRLNYFVYPHVEVAGEKFEQYTSRFSYRWISD